MVGKKYLLEDNLYMQILMCKYKKIIILLINYKIIGFVLKDKYLFKII
jgi:hypothetical protein